MSTSLMSIIVYYIVLLILFYSQSPPFLMLRGPDKDGNIPVGNERFDGRLYFSQLINLVHIAHVHTKVVMILHNIVKVIAAYIY